MTPEEYQNFVDGNWSRNEKVPRKGTAKYDYYILRQLHIMTAGVGGEAGEVQELLKKSVRDHNLNLNHLKLELGDVLHYVTRIASWHGMDLQQVMDANVKKLKTRRKREQQNKLRKR